MVNQFNGITYRDLSMKQNNLKFYSFISTSKNRSIAQLFADNTQENISTDDHLIEIPVLLKYTIKQGLIFIIYQ